MRLNRHVLRRLQTVHTVTVKRDILHTVKRAKVNCKGHIRRRSCLLNHTIAWKIEETMTGMGKRGRRRKQLLDDLKEKTYWKLKEEALDRTLWRTGFGKGYGAVARRTTESIKRYAIVTEIRLSLQDYEYSKKSEGQLQGSHPAQKPPFKSHYCMKDKRNDERDGETRKTT